MGNTRINVVSNFLAPDLQTLVIVLQGRVVGGDQAPGDDLEELSWVSSVEELPAMAFDSDRYIVGRFFNGDLRPPCRLIGDTPAKIGDRNVEGTRSVRAILQ